MHTLNDIKKFMIQSSRDFCCPVTKEILDYRRSVIIRNNKQDIILSETGYNKIKKQLSPSIVLIDTIEKFVEEN